MQVSATENKKAMKQILLLTLTLFISVAGFSQNSINNSASWNKSFFNEKEVIPELKIYPNPCKTNLVNIDFNTKEISEIQLINITGKQIFSKKFISPQNKTQVQLNDVQNGMYLLKVKSTDNKTVVKKFIISKE